VEGATRLVFVGGQNGITADGTLVGEDIASQTKQALWNLLEALKAAGATQQNVVRLTIYIVEGQDLNAAFAASQEVWGSNPTAVSGLFVAGLAVPGALIEIDAVAAV
jgi:enamine deaminase RidA (YjgF/YER057c/UK114 family)